MAKLTDAYLRNLKGAAGETHVERVGGGLELWVTVNQAGQTAKKWVLRYYATDGKRQKARIGEYPDLSLAKAQALSEDMKKKAKEEGVNLAQEQAKARRVKVEDVQTERQNTFENVARAWLEKKGLEWDPAHAKRQQERLSGNIFPAFGDLELNTVTMQHIDDALRPIIARGARETAQRVCTIVKSIFDYADTMGILSDALIIRRLERYRKDMPQPVEKKHLYKEMSEGEIGKLLSLIEGSKMRWTLQTSVALRMAPYVMLRPNELCGARWEEIDIETAEWLIPARRMKPGRDHLVPLPRQAVELLLEIRPFSGANELVFPSPKKHREPITTASLIQALRRIGYASTREEGDAFVTHGFRGMASTVLHQKLKFDSDIVELQLSHIDQNRVKTAYNQITTRSYLEERREMLQVYADYLDNLREIANR